MEHTLDFWISKLMQPFLAKQGSGESQWSPPLQVAPSQLCVGPLAPCLPPKHHSARLLHFTFAMSIWCQPQSCAP